MGRVKELLINLQNSREEIREWLEVERVPEGYNEWLGEVYSEMAKEEEFENNFVNMESLFKLDGVK